MNRGLSLLSQLEKLVSIDHSLSFDSQNPKIYRERAILLQQLGCNALAMHDNRICAYLEKRDDIEYYNLNYLSIIDDNEFSKIYKSESNTYYYEVFFDILQNDKLLLKDTIDPIHFALRSGNAVQLGLFNLSLRDCNDAMKYLAPFPQEYAIAAVNKALLLLLIGDYEQGWKLYEKRWETNYKSFKNPIVFQQPKWKGEQLALNDRLYIISEQEIGDNIQFIRYAILLKQQGINIVVCNNEYIDDFLTYNLTKYDIPTVKISEKTHFSYWIRMMSLPYLCHSSLTNIPLTLSYLEPPTEYLEKWKNKLRFSKNRKKVGVVWRGGVNTNTDKIRSIPISLFSKLFTLDMDFYVIQKEVNEQEIIYLEKYHNVYDLHHELYSFSDTSSIIEQLDLIISVDTSVAHLSAAQGKQTWILVNYRPDFRWLINREDSVWYSCVRLFRQHLDYNWNTVINSVFQELSS
ncbi:hypothetical protein BMT54_10285 [Pasteurellaceae bacterium 15-036681]|nr:hypothetical protein BMT54_10285 [Pasteurellaceae bacterium 15-036681]